MRLLFRSNFLNSLFHTPFLFRVFSIISVFVVLLPSSQVKASDTEVIIGPQIDIFIGPRNQGHHGIDVAFDSTNKRFLVVWCDGGVQEIETNLYGQLVNTDGTLYSTPIPIRKAGDSQALSPKVVFDPNNIRFIVVWSDNRSHAYLETYGQLVNADGSLYGNNFIISDSNRTLVNVAFSITLSRFLVLMRENNKLYGQFLNSDGSLIDSNFLINNLQGIMHTSNIGYDSNNDRFLVAYTYVEETEVRGRLINADGTSYGKEITISSSWTYWWKLLPIVFDAANNRYLIVWGLDGQFVNTDGTILGEHITISDDVGFITSDIEFYPDEEKYLVVGYNTGVFGQLLNSDGTVYSEGFIIDPFLYPSPKNAFVAFGSDEIGFIVVWHSTLYEDMDTFGKLLKNIAATTTTAPITTTTTTTTDGGGSTTTTETNTSTSAPSCPLELVYAEHSEVAELLRNFRDNVLSQTSAGQEIIKLYYLWSPIIVKAMKEDEEFKQDLKEMIDEILVLIME